MCATCTLYTSGYPIPDTYIQMQMRISNTYIRISNCRCVYPIADAYIQYIYPIAVVTVVAVAVVAVGLALALAAAVATIM